MRAVSEGLRSLVATPLTAALNLAVAVLIVVAVPPLVDWAILDATFFAEGTDGCPPQGGACWAFIGAKARLTLFGPYPYDEQWRAAIATVVLVVLVALSLDPRNHRRWLAGAWAAGGAVYALLMWGGVLGLRFVDTTLWGGLPLTILLTVFGVFFGLIVAVPVALARFSSLPVFRVAATMYVELVRGVPLISVIFMASIMLPVFLPDGLTPNGLGRVLIGIVFFFAAYMAEVLRGGLQAIPHGQLEAAQALGLRYWVVMGRIVLPQAFEIVLPAMINLVIGALKGTSLVVIVSMMDLLGAAKASLADPNWIGFYVEAFVFAALIYAAMCGAISRYGRRVEARLHLARGGR